MMAETSIEWTDFTVNFWWGCTKVGPGCDHCYAEVWDKRTGGAHWGPHADRRQIKGAEAALRKINRDAPAYHAKHGHWPRVFMHSMSDLFDNAVPYVWREHALEQAELATQTRIQMVTKRVGNVEEMVFPVWQQNWPQNIGLMITVCNQAEADRDIPKLLDLKVRLGIPWVGLSIEPMLGPIDLTLYGLVCGPCQNLGEGMSMDSTTGAYECCRRCDYTGIGDEWAIDWVICGGESGPHARPMHPDWARSLRDQCVAAGVPFLFKQWGEWLPMRQGGFTSWSAANIRNNGMGGNKWLGLANFNDAMGGQNTKTIGPVETCNLGGLLLAARIGKKSAGRLLDGRTWDEVPHDV